MGGKDGDVYPGRRGEGSGGGRDRGMGAVENLWVERKELWRERNGRKEKKEGVRPRRRRVRDSWP